MAPRRFVSEPRAARRPGNSAGPDATVRVHLPGEEKLPTRCPTPSLARAGFTARSITSLRRALRLYLAGVKDATVLRALLWEDRILR